MKGERMKQQQTKPNSKVEEKSGDLKQGKLRIALLYSYSLVWLVHNNPTTPTILAPLSRNTHSLTLSLATHSYYFGS
jgi:hypothetical protein